MNDQMVEFDRRLACSIAPRLRMHCSKEGKAIVTFMPGKPDFEAEDTLYIDTGDTDENSGGIESVEAMLIKYVSAMGRMPSLVVVRDLGHFVLSKADNQKSGRLAGRISIVTGGAQGFGRGIAEAMAAEGALIVIADLNPDGAKRCADELNDIYGSNTAIAVAVDVSDEYSVERMVQDTVLAFGGLDVLVSNAGVLIAGSVSDMTKEHFDFVTRVNYTGYFLCTKYAAQPMKIQNEVSPGYLTDIIEINSKSGLEGSNKNFAYAGSKFGGIGLTQSFAMELIEFGIKVNAICPGNLLDGPLWSDPEKGLFKQYLDSGKVEGAKTISDVRRFYENKVPMGRGCTTEDVARAIFYVIEQKYETGQAIPVTGGQVMLK